jgi:branched-chain amino acid transport system ATP-binding protein
MANAMPKLENVDTFPKLLMENARVRGSMPAYREKNLGIWHTWTWAQTKNEVECLAGGLRALGLKPGDWVYLSCENRPYHYWAICAIQSLGAIPSPHDLNAPFAIVEGQEQVDALLHADSKLLHIIAKNSLGMEHYRDSRLAFYHELRERGASYKSNTPHFFSECVEQGSNTDIAISFNSLDKTDSFENLIALALDLNLQEGLTEDEQMLVHLPPNDIPNFTLSFARAYAAGYCINCPENNETLVENLHEIAPSYFAAPGHFFESIAAKALNQMNEELGYKGQLFKYFMEHPNLEKAVPRFIGNIIFFNQIKNILGLSRTRHVLAIGENSQDTFFRRLNLEIKYLPAIKSCSESELSSPALLDNRIIDEKIENTTTTLQPLLSITNLSLSFGGITALKDVDFSVRQGEIRAIIGPNGAGKSSLLNCLNGFYQPQKGKLEFKNEIVPRMRPRIAAKLGISRTFQNIALFPGMNSLDNIMTGRNLKMHKNFLWQALHIGPARQEEIENRIIAEKMIRFLRLEAVRKTRVGELPYGIQKRVELARALVAEPDLILLDEPMAGMNREEKEDMCRTIIEVNQELGTTVVLIEHDMSVIMDISDRIAVLDQGMKIADGTPAGISANEDVIRAYLGVQHSQD